MINTNEIITTDWIAIYGAGLASLIAVVHAVKHVKQKIKTHRERAKFQTDLYFLRKIDRSTKKVHPIVVILLANLGLERIAIKSLEFKGIAENGLETNGCMGWYEQPEESLGIRNRLLPIVLKSGQTADLPMIKINYITRIQNLKIWLTDFDEHRYYLAAKDISKVKLAIEKFLLENKEENLIISKPS